MAFTGQAAAAMIEHCDLVLYAPSEAMSQIQQIPITAARAICSLVERALFPQKRGIISC
jgi:hypothetical protein